MLVFVEALLDCHLKFTHRQPHGLVREVRIPKPVEHEPRRAGLTRASRAVQEQACLVPWLPLVDSLEVIGEARDVSIDERNRVIRMTLKEDVTELLKDLGVVERVIPVCRYPRVSASLAREILGHELVLPGVEHGGEWPLAPVAERLVFSVHRS